MLAVTKGTDASGVTLTKFTIRRPRLKFLAPYKVQKIFSLLKIKNLKKVDTIFSRFVPQIIFSPNER